MSRGGPFVKVRERPFIKGTHGRKPFIGEEAACRGREAAVHHRREKAMGHGMNWTSCGCGGKEELRKNECST